MFCTCNSCVVYMYDTHACINVPEIPLSICAFIIIFIPPKCLNTVIQLFMLKHITVLSESGIRLTIFISLSGFCFFFSTSLTPKNHCFMKEFFNVQKKILDDITCLYRDQYFLYLKEFLLLDIWIRLIGISSVNVILLQFYFVDLYVNFEQNIYQ